ncbi:MAG: hypothetical protein ACP5N2_04805 [Candidatus Nanoarchaeia archaeon]
MKLYHGFLSLEMILGKNKVQSPSLASFKTNPSPLYIFPALLRVAGDIDILPNYTFNLKETFYKNEAEALASLKDFDVTLTNIQIEIVRNLVENRTNEYRNEFYRCNGIYLSEQPTNRAPNLFVFDVPEKLIQKSPQGWPLVAGELSLDYLTGLLVDKRSEFRIKELLEKYDKHNLQIESY